MNSARHSLVVIMAAAITLGSCSKRDETPAAQPAASSKAATPGDPIASAESAAPKSISAAATVISMGEDGKMSELRKGTNGWTCMPDNPTTPGPDPMCMDGNALAWANAWMGHKPPPTHAPGVMYMLSGGTDASNTDPYATKPSEGSDWIKTGPHLMIVGSAAILKGHPAGQQPDTTAPYVMWQGTPYAHLMVPVG